MRSVGAALMAAALILAAEGCGDGSGPGAGLSSAEKTAIANAFRDSRDVASNPLTPISSVVLRVLSETGTFAGGAYQGAGVDITYSIQLSGGPTISGEFAGVLAWSGMNADAGTVDELLIVGFEGSEADFSFAAFLWHRATGRVFTTAESEATELQATSSSGSGRDCSANTPGFTETCTLTTGLLSGFFSFTATQVGGDATHVQPSTSLSNLPIFKIVFTAVQQ